jgi:ketosteroid isomerase-like protein
MPRDRVAILEGVYQEWARGNFRAGAELLSEDVVFAIDYPHGPQTYFGRDGVESYMREILAEWEHMEVRATEMVEVNDRVLVYQQQVQTGSASGVRVEGRTGAIWTFSGDRVVRLQLFQDQAEARSAAGLDG